MAACLRVLAVPCPPISIEISFLFHHWKWDLFEGCAYRYKARLCSAFIFDLSEFRENYELLLIISI